MSGNARDRNLVPVLTQLSLLCSNSRLNDGVSLDSVRRVGLCNVFTSQVVLSLYICRCCNFNPNNVVRRNLNTFLALLFPVLPFVFLISRFLFPRMVDLDYKPAEG